MQTQIIRDTQRDSWNKFSPGWKKWDLFTMDFLESQGKEIIKALQLDPHDQVLDIASGTGEPGLTIAGILTGGTVTAVDLSEGMLRIAQEKAEYQGLQNFNTLVADACELPFADHSFDAISCRLGFMFFPDMLVAAKEMLRVLKPGGRLATTVWGEPAKNVWITAIMGAIKRNIDLPTPPPDAPGMFRCAQPGALSTLFAEAGCPGAVEKDIEGVINCKSTDEYWSFMNDVVPPVVAVFSQSSQELKDRIKHEVFTFAKEKCPDEGREFRFGAKLITLTKPAV